MKKLLQIGDRVRVYGHGSHVIKPVLGIVCKAIEGEFLEIKTDRKSPSQENVEYIWAHQKQCRRITAAHSVWLDPSRTDVSIVRIGGSKPGPSWVRMVKAKKQ